MRELGRRFEGLVVKGVSLCVRCLKPRVHIGHSQATPTLTDVSHVTCGICHKPKTGSVVLHSHPMTTLLPLPILITQKPISTLGFLATSWQCSTALQQRITINIITHMITTLCYSIAAIELPPLWAPAAGNITPAAAG